MMQNDVRMSYSFGTMMCMCVTSQREGTKTGALHSSSTQAGDRQNM